MLLRHTVGIAAMAMLLLAVAFDTAAGGGKDGKDKDKPFWLEAAEIPDWVDALLGPNQGIRSMGINHGDNPCVTLYTGGSAYHFRISICPKGVEHGPLPWWVGEVGQFTQRQGIYLATEGK